jgi:ATP-dependent RNA helicase RhlE
LVATDVAALGLEIEQLPLVINYEFQDCAEHYVYRMGRTQLAGSRGGAISLAAPDEREQLAAIEKLLKTRLPVVAVPEFDQQAAARRDGVDRFEPRREGRPERRSDARRPERPRFGASRVHRSAAASDPIFTQPYSPPLAVADHDRTAPADPISAMRLSERSAKPLAALLLPPVPSRQEN